MNSVKGVKPKKIALLIMVKYPDGRRPCRRVVRVRKPLVVVISLAE